MPEPVKIDVLARPLYVFDLPEHLLNTLQVKAEDGVPVEQLSEKSKVDEASTEASKSGDKTGSSTATACALCTLNFSSVDEQRKHVRSDLHSYNLKQKVNGRKVVSEAQFEHLLEKLDESISGSDSETSEDEAEKDGDTVSTKAKADVLNALMKRQAKIGDTENGETEAEIPKRKKGPGKPPMIYFTSSVMPSNLSIAIYRTIFDQSEQTNEQELLAGLRKRQCRTHVISNKAAAKGDEDNDDGGVPLPGTIDARGVKTSDPHYFLCMIGGGHFAAMLVSLAAKHNKKSQVQDRSATVIAHKTFHRYTTRRKQGGSQSANDNSKGNAHSAGSSLRRYNEAALESDVRSLLNDWKSWIDTSELLFIRASGTTNRRVLFGPYDAQVLNTRDPRIRSFPFETRRATQSELMRAFQELTRAKVCSNEKPKEVATKQEDPEEARRKAQQALDRAAASKTPKYTKEEEAAILHTTQIQALLRRSRAPALVSYYTTNNLSPDFRFLPAERNHHAPTALHLASSSNAPACVTALLMKVGADPAVKNGDGRTAFELAGDRATRDAFALARGQLGEQRWNWDQARVPQAITQEEANKRALSEKQEEAAANQAEKERRQAEIERLRKEDQSKQNGIRDQKHGLGKSLGAAPMSAEQRRMEDARGMTDEMRMKLERERRARAAEARMRRPQE